MAAQTNIVQYLVYFTALFRLCPCRKALHGIGTKPRLQKRTFFQTKRIFHALEPATGRRRPVHQSDSQYGKYPGGNQCPCHHENATHRKIQGLERRKSELYGYGTLLQRCPTLSAGLRDMFPPAVLCGLYNRYRIRNHSLALAGSRHRFLYLAVALYRASHRHQ